MIAELHTQGGPGVEVVGRGDRTGLAVVATDRPVLGESGCTLDRRLIDTLGGQDVVGAAVRDNSTLLGGTRGRVVSAEALDDVVLDERVLGPAVDAQVGVAIRVVGACERDGASSAWIPALASDEVALVAGPGDCVLATSFVGVRDIALPIGPEAVVVAIVGTGRRRRASALGKLSRTAIRNVRWSCESCDGRSRENERLGEEHCESKWSDCCLICNGEEVEVFDIRQVAASAEATTDIVAIASSPRLRSTIRSYVQIAPPHPQSCLDCICYCTASLPSLH